MILAVVTMVKNEEDIVEHMLKHFIDEGVDVIVIADNLSTDKTREKILSVESYAIENGCKLVLEIDNEFGYTQSKKMTALTKKAHDEYDADWVIAADCDEIWWHPDDRLKVIFEKNSDLKFSTGEPIFNFAIAHITNYFPSALDLPGENPFETIQWRQAEPQALPKMAFRYFDDCVIEQGNHSVTTSHQGRSFDLQLAHFPYRTYQQFENKAKNGAEVYDATDLPEDMGTHWRGYGRILQNFGKDALHEVFTTYFWFLSPIDAGLVHDPAPFRRWQ